jgi:hypothetical protein
MFQTPVAQYVPRVLHLVALLCGLSACLLARCAGKHRTGRRDENIPLRGNSANFLSLHNLRDAGASAHRPTAEQLDEMGRLVGRDT